MQATGHAFAIVVIAVLVVVFRFYRRHKIRTVPPKYLLTMSAMLFDSNTNMNSMTNRRGSLFYRYPLKAFYHMVCPCTLDGVCVVCPGTSELVCQHPPQYPYRAQRMEIVNRRTSRNRDGAGGRKFSDKQLNK